MERIVRARVLRRHSTPAEQLLWSVLRDRRLGGFKFRRQRPIGAYVVDFVCLERRLIVEVDGLSHDLTAEHDERRDATLRAAGYRVLRFGNDEVRAHREGVRQAILDALEAKEEPSPSHRFASCAPAHAGRATGPSLSREGQGNRISV
jgi:very-short-patch-repair endonuclease